LDNTWEKRRRRGRGNPYEGAGATGRTFRRLSAAALSIKPSVRYKP
jgi:hypothetical protein